MTDRERSQDVKEEEQADSPEFSGSTQDPEGGGGETTPGENDPPIIISGG